MKSNLSPKTKSIKPLVNQPINKQDKPFQKLAVLFTDVAGSTDFFSSHGDMDGRKMLQQHQDIASSAISEYGGTLVKSLGDSVMAHFLNPEEALKSAIKIQQNFQIYNHAKDLQDQIHIRIGIHFGDAIVEEKDIFGNVVNVASKLTTLAVPDQIYISRDIYDSVQSLSPIQFELIDVPDTKDIPEGLGIYRVIWEESAKFDPTVKTLLYFKPVWKLDTGNFSSTWNHLLKAKNKYWGGKVEKESILPDKSVILIVKKPQSAFTVAKDVMRFLRRSMDDILLPIQIIVDSGPYIRADKVVTEGLKVNWEEIVPGEIYISFSTYRLVKNDDTSSIFSLPDTGISQSFYRLIPDEDQQKDEQFLFLYHDALIQGKNYPCYYCGNKNHLSKNCPSKKLPQVTNSLNKLGYLSLDTINRLFFKYLVGESSELPAESETYKNPGISAILACLGFYDLKKVFQIRSFRTIWDAKSDTWDNTMERKNKESMGGIVWLAYDCLRVSNLPQAESFLKTSIKEAPEDYKAYCAMGFLNLERDNVFRAEHFFNKALYSVRTKPQKIFLLLLLSRLYDLNDDFVRARQKIKEIISIDPDCPEAVYQDIIFKFRQGKKNEAIKCLIKLIQQNREYYLCALIDPELALFSEIIYPQLKKLFNAAKSEATQVFHEAEKKLEGLKRVLDKEDKELAETQSLRSKIGELLKTDSYFGYLDTIQYGNFITSISRKGIEERRKKLLNSLYELNNRLKRNQTFVSNYRLRSRISSPEQQLIFFQAKTDQIYNMVKLESSDPGKFKDVSGQLEKLSTELDQIELKSKKLKTVWQVNQLLTWFFKYFLIFQSVILFVTLIVFPIVSFYMDLLPPKFNIPFVHNTCFYQKKLFVWGGISGLLLAISMTIKKWHKK